MNHWILITFNECLDTIQTLRFIYVEYFKIVLQDSVKSLFITGD